MMEIIIMIAVAIIVFLVCREIVCWYWKINERIENQRIIISKLDQLLGRKEEQENNPGQH